MIALDCVPNPLAGTGVPVLELIGLAVFVLVAGAALLWTGRSRRPRALVALGLALVVAAAAWTGGQPTARASSSTSCAAQGGSGVSGEQAGGSGGSGVEGASTGKLVITQISVDDDLGPGRPAQALVGRAVNDGPSATVINSITVTVVGVTRAPGAPPGACDATDYVLTDPVMAVGRTVPQGAAITFGGASIGFVDKPVNQDACQGARVTLRYTSR